MIRITEIQSLTDFQRNAKSTIKKLRATGRPQVLTVNGKAELVVQDAQSYQRMLDLLDRAEAIEGIRRGLEQARSGKTRPLAAAIDEIRRRGRVRKRA